MFNRDNPPQEIMFAPLFDYRDATKNSLISSMQFFHLPCGIFDPSTQQMITAMDTNSLLAGGFLPSGVRFLITTIKFYCSLVPGTERNALMHAPALLTLTIGHKLYVEDGPLAKFPALFDTFPFALDPLDSLNKLDIYRVALDKVTNKITPLQLESHQPFEVQVHFKEPYVPSRKFRYGVILDGFRTRDCD